MSRANGPLFVCAADTPDSLRPSGELAQVAEVDFISLAAEPDAGAIEAAAACGFSLVRYLDTHWLLLPKANPESCQAVVDAFFCWLSEDYDSTIDVDRNVRNIRYLMSLCLKFGLRSPNRVLDFGCGTGISTVALDSLPEVQLVGFDSCSRMVDIAEARGLSVLDLQDLMALGPCYFDAIFSSYTMHLLFEREGLALAWDSMRTGGVLAANFHKSVGLGVVSEFLHGLGAQLVFADDGPGEHGVYRVFRKST